MLQVMRSAFGLASVPLHGQILATAFTACKPQSGIVRTFEASPVITVRTAVKLHLLSLSQPLGEKILAAVEPRAAPTERRIEPITVNRNRSGGMETFWRHFRVDSMLQLCKLLKNNVPP